MSEQEFEDYLILLSRFLGLTPEQREAIADELRDHMHERLETLQRLGVPRKEAIREALAEFGDVSRLASELSNLANRKQQKRRWMMRVTAGSLAVVAVMAIVAMAIWPDPMPGPRVSSVQAENNDDDAESAKPANEAAGSTPTSIEGVSHERIRNALREKGRFEFEDTPLTEVFDFLENQLGIQIEVDDRALDDIQIDLSSETVTFSEPPMSYEAALRHILHRFDLTTTIQHGVLMVTAWEEAETERTTRLYPVWDLARATNDTDRADYDSLIDVVTSTILPDSWEDVGGPGSLAPHKGLLLISQTDEVQRDVEALLKALRAFPRLEEAATPKAGGDRRSRTVELADNAAKRRIDEKLGNEISVEFVDTPLGDVVDYIQQEIQEPVIIDERALEDAGLASSSEIVTTSLKGVSIRSALRLILANLGLTYAVRHEALVITTQEEAENSLTTRLYSAVDLIDVVDATDYEQIKVELKELADTLMAIISPESWSNVGGPAVLGVYASRGVLVCSNTADVHERMESLLGEMARARRSPQAAPRRQEPYNPAEVVVETYQLNPLYINSNDIVEVVTALVDPAGWDQRPASAAASTRPYVKLFSGKLIVRQRRDIQREIQQLLRRLGVIGQHGNAGQGDSGGGMF